MSFGIPGLSVWTKLTRIAKRSSLTSKARGRSKRTKACVQTPIRPSGPMGPMGPNWGHWASWAHWDLWTQD
eukprot:3689307-Karenia_brevis.AAC.1